MKLEITHLHFANYCLHCCLISVAVERQFLFLSQKISSVLSCSGVMLLQGISSCECLCWLPLFVSTVSCSLPTTEGKPFSLKPLPSSIYRVLDSQIILPTFLLSNSGCHYIGTYLSLSFSQLFLLSLYWVLHLLSSSTPSISGRIFFRTTHFFFSYYFSDIFL